MGVLNVVEVNFDVDGVKGVGDWVAAVFLEGDAEAADETGDAVPRLLGGAIAVGIDRVAVAEIRAGVGVYFGVAEFV